MASELFAAYLVRKLFQTCFPNPIQPDQRLILLGALLQFAWDDRSAGH
jgi:hypothetical protein